MSEGGEGRWASQQEDNGDSKEKILRKQNGLEK